MLRVVRAPTGSQGGDPPARRRPTTLALTDVEAMRLRAALRNLRALYGSWGCLAAVMGVPTKSIMNIAGGDKRPSPGMARKAAHAAGKTLDMLLAGPTDASRCPTCGAARGGST